MHYIYLDIHSRGGVYDSQFSLNHIFAIICSSWGLVGVNAFIIISSFYLLNSNKIKLEKVLQIVLTASVYSLIAYLFSAAWNQEVITVKQIAKAVLLPLLNNYWFVTGYVLLYLLHPLLNKIINLLAEKQLKWLCLYCCLLVYFYKFIIISAPIDTFSIFVTEYICVAFYKKKITALHKIVDHVGIFSAIVVLTIEILYTFVDVKAGIVKFIAVQTIGKYSFFMFAIALCVFDIAYRRKEVSNLRLGFWAGNTLAVYVFHESDYINQLLWDGIFNVPFWFTSKLFPLFFVFIVLIVFVICTLLDKVLQPIIKRSALIINKIFYKCIAVLCKNNTIF